MTFDDYLSEWWACSTNSQDGNSSFATPWATLFDLLIFFSANTIWHVIDAHRSHFLFRLVEIVSMSHQALQTGTAVPMTVFQNWLQFHPTRAYFQGEFPKTYKWQCLVQKLVSGYLFRGTNPRNFQICFCIERCLKKYLCLKQTHVDQHSLPGKGFQRQPLRMSLVVKKLWNIKLAV